MNQYIQIIRDQKQVSGSMSRASYVTGVNYDAVATANFQIKKAEDDPSIMTMAKSMLQAGGTEVEGSWFANSKFYSNDTFFMGPKTDAEANTNAGWAMALQARTMPSNQRSELIKVAKEYVAKGSSAFQRSRDTNRQKILLKASDKLKDILEPYAKEIGVNKRGELRSGPLSVLRESAKKENLEFRMASTVFGEPCREGETEAECSKRQTRDTYIRYGLFGIFGLTALGAVGIYYVNTIKGAVKSVTGGKKPSSKPKKQQIIEQQKPAPKQQIIEQQITAQEQ